MSGELWRDRLQRLGRPEAHPAHPPTGADAPTSYAQGEKTRVAIPTTIAPVSTAYVAYEAKIAADTARALGQTDDAARYDRLFEEIKDDFNAKCGTRALATTARTRTRSRRRRSRRSRSRSASYRRKHRRRLQEKLIHDIMVTRDGQEMVGIVGSRCGPKG